MKSFFLTSIITGLFLSLTLTTNAEVINGNGSVSSYNYEVPSYTKLKVEGNFDVYLSFGTQPSVTVKTDDNLQDAVLIDSDGTTLFIRTKENMGETTQLAIYITVNTLDQMAFKDVISINSTEALWFNSLNLNLNTFGSTKLQLACKNLNATIEGAGDLYLTGTVEHLNITNNGMGNLYTSDLSTRKVTMNQRGNKSIEMKMVNEKALEVKMLPVSESMYPKA